VVPQPSVPNNADEPYSPGGSDDELVPSAPQRPNDLERQVNEINKQIAAQQMEIAGLLKVEPTVSADLRRRKMFPIHCIHIPARFFPGIRVLIQCASRHINTRKSFKDPGQHQGQD